VELIEPNAVVCKNGQRFETDVLIYCTGYTFNFPYLKPATLLPVHGHEVDLYKFVFTPELDTLAIIGLIQPIGSVAPISEMQVSL
jgi:dimethylaniline monooxygenase (N-oxide forming)